MPINELNNIPDSYLKKKVVPLRYLSVLEAIGVGIVILNNKSKTVHVNDCMARWLDSNADDLKKKPLFKFLPAYEGSHENEFDTFKNKIGIVSFECQYKRKRGTDRLLKVSVVPIAEADENTFDLLLIHTEVAGTEKIATPLRTDGEFHIMDSLKDYAVITLDINRTVLNWNKGAEAIFGYKEEEIIGKTADILFTVEDNTVCKNATISLQP